MQNKLFGAGFFGLFLPVILSGCSTLGLGEKSDFECASIPDYEGCIPVSELYELSEDTDDIMDAMSRKQAKTASAKAAKAAKNDVGTPTDAVISPEAQVVIPAMDRPVAIIRDPKVARLYIGPWKDANDVLQMATYAYIKVEDSEFNFGIEKTASGEENVFYPLHFDQNESAEMSDLADKKQGIKRYLPSKRMLEQSQVEANDVIVP